MRDKVELAQPPKLCPECDTRLRPDARFCGNCGTKLPHEDEWDASSLVGSLVAGAYRIDGVLGTGSMGVVYRAEQVALKRQVALKVIGESSDDDTTRARFRREARAASQLNHPNVVQVYDFGELPGGQPYLAMELLNGQTLEQLIDAEFPLEWGRVIVIMIDVLTALQAAHDMGILHRDLKPANVFISEGPNTRETAKVLDFGIATAMDGTLTGSKTWAPLTEAGFVCGTPAFMSPEQVQGFQLDQRSDLFSAGGLMYQMLTKERPFKGKSPVEVGANIVLKPLIPPTRTRPDLEIPAAVDDLLLASMAKKADDRYASATDMMAALEQILQNPHAPIQDLRAPHVEALPASTAPTHAWPETHVDEIETADTVVDLAWIGGVDESAPAPPSTQAPIVANDEAVAVDDDTVVQEASPVALPPVDLFSVGDPWPELTPSQSLPAVASASKIPAVERTEELSLEDLDDLSDLDGLDDQGDADDLGDVDDLGNLVARERELTKPPPIPAGAKSGDGREPVYTPIALKLIPAPKKKDKRPWLLWLILALVLVLVVVIAVVMNS